MCFHSTASTNFLQVLSTMNFSLNILYSPLTLCLKKTSVLNYISYNTPIHPIIFYLSQHILVATLTLCMLFTLFAPAANVNAASKRTKALTAYQKKLKKLDSKIYKFALVYLDKIPYRNFSLHRILAYMPLPEKFIPTLAANLNS